MTRFSFADFLGELEKLFNCFIFMTRQNNDG